MDFNDYKPMTKEEESQNIIKNPYQEIKKDDDREKTRKSGSFFKICSFNYWQSYFNFEQSEIGTRLKKAIFMQDLGSLLYEDPDLYNPLWINITLCFGFIIISNISKYLEVDDKGEFHFDYSLVQKAFIMIFGLAIVVPGLIIVFFYFFGFGMSVKSGLGISAIYSYSNIFFILGVILTLVPWKIFDWVVMGIAAFLTLLFLNLNYGRYINKFPKKNAKFVLIFITAFQGFALVSYILVFYS